MSEPRSSTYTPDPARRAPDLGAFARAVRFRDRATAAAVAHHERAGLQPSQQYARATFDAIEQMIREDERARLDEAGRLLPADAVEAWRLDWPLFGDTRGLGRRRVLTWPDGSTWVGPWLPVPATNTEED